VYRSSLHENRCLTMARAVGAGVEVGVERNWTFKVEYLYVDLGSRQMFNVVPGVPETVSFTANIVRAGFNYKFY
jgi:outer membrane immunogenic protein